MVLKRFMKTTHERRGMILMTLGMPCVLLYGTDEAWRWGNMIVPACQIARFNAYDLRLEISMPFLGSHA